MPDQQMIQFAKNFHAACEKMADALEAADPCILTTAEVRAVVDWMHSASSPQVRAMSATMTLEDLKNMVQRVVGS